MELPLPSSNVQLMVYEPSTLKEVGSVVVPVIVPAQLSVVVGAEAVRLHSSVKVASVGVMGGVLSTV